MTDLPDLDATDRDPMAQLADAAERLRAVRRAHGRFLALWAVDHLLTATADRLTPDNLTRAADPIQRWPNRLADDEG